MRKIKNICVPTDFSDTARNAYHYAKQLAETLNASVTVVHVNEFILPASEIVLTPISDLEMSRMTDESMQNFVSEEEDSEAPVMVKTRVKTKVLRGDLVDKLLELSESNDTDLMVVGTTGMQGILSKILGSTSQLIANKARCPVLLVPPDAQWHGLKKVMLASNYDTATPKMIGEVADFARAFSATIHFVHVRDFSESSEGEAETISWEKIFPVAKPGYSFEVHSIYGSNKIDELKKYAEKHAIDLMAFVSKHRGFWESMVHKSVTENIALASDTPLMVIHLDDKGR